MCPPPWWCHHKWFCVMLDILYKTERMFSFLLFDYVHVVIRLIYSNEDNWGSWGTEASSSRWRLTRSFSIVSFSSKLTLAYTVLQSLISLDGPSPHSAVGSWLCVQEDCTQAGGEPGSELIFPREEKAMSYVPLWFWHKINPVLYCLWCSCCNRLPLMCLG